MFPFLLQVAGSDYYYPVDFAENIYNPEAWQGRIVSGWEARPGQHPHQVSLRMITLLGSVSSCGGSVVAREWVITSAHCTATRITIVVRAGVTSLTRPEFIVESTLYYNYPTYDSSRPGVVQPDDIALVKLPTKLDYSRNLQPIRIQSSADAHRNYEDLVVYASGFGRTWTNGATTEVLRWTYLRAVSNPTCAQLFGSSIITANTLCARYYNVTSQSVCQGDSGGPLVHVDARGVPILVGVSSFVAGDPFGCHSGLPSGFARPGPFHSWYKEVTEIDFENLEEDTTTSTTTVAPTTVTFPTVTIPTVTTPNITVPTVTVPTVTTPNITVPTVTVPTITTPNITVPTVTIPTMTTPNITFSTVTVPTITTPNITVPTVTVPTMTTPNITFSTVTVPTITTPNTTIPTLTTPNITFSTVTVPTLTTSNSTFPNVTISTMTTPYYTITPNSTFTTPNITVSTTPTPPTTTPTPEGDDDEDDPELSELLKRLEVKVGVVVRLTKRGRNNNNKEVLVE
ncbi:transmembrane protease serine 9-like [Maniola jurtina]|uniref:transmembrane protease serine 9-like n=1 Tax=Maniola jurtina TaxID=191418 RepID=UPI001E68F9DA|nr:transmembrane protease serine 9-like [Maniola jurtina]